MREIILVSKINKCFYDRHEMDLEPHELKFIEDLKTNAKYYSNPYYGKGLVNGYTDRYLEVSEKQSNWFDYIYEYKGLLNTKK